jgi:stress-induced morphogen
MSTNDAEAAIASVLMEALEPSDLIVRDVSGGCGSMYAIEIASPKFRDISILKQQRLVNAALGDMVKQWHGVQIRTKPTPQ